MSKIYEALQLEQKRRIGSPVHQQAVAQDIAIDSSPATAVPVEHTSWIVQESTRRAEGNIDEELIGLYYSIESQIPGHESRIIQFIGSQDGEGTSMIAYELSRVAATELHKSVLLFDADSKHRPALGHPTEVQTSFEQLMQNDGQTGEALQLKDGKPFLVCPISSNGTSPAAILNSPRAEPTLRDMKTHFDLIVIDSPPLSRSAQGLAICRKTDGVILVLEAENTRGSIAAANKEKIEKAGGRVLGVVLNKRRNHIPKTLQKLF